MLVIIMAGTVYDRLSKNPKRQWESNYKQRYDLYDVWWLCNTAVFLYNYRNPVSWKQRPHLKQQLWVQIWEIELVSVWL